MVVADIYYLISRHIPTSKTCCRLVLICYRFVDLQQNRRFTTTMNPDPGQQTDIIKKSFLPPLAKGRRLRTDRECLEDRPKEEVTKVLHAARLDYGFSSICEC